MILKSNVLIKDKIYYFKKCFCCLFKLKADFSTSDVSFMTLHPDRDVNYCIIFHYNTLKICGDISPKTQI